MGTRELCSQLCEALADDLQASDCLVSRVDAERDLLVDVAGFTRTPQRWLAPAVEYPIDRYPATRKVLEDGRPYTTWVGDRSGDAAERELMRGTGVCAGLVTRSLEAARRAYPGFDANHVANLELDVKQNGYDEARAIWGDG